MTFEMGKPLADAPAGLIVIHSFNARKPRVSWMPQSKKLTSSSPPRSCGDEALLAVVADGRGSEWTDVMPNGAGPQFGLRLIADLAEEAGGRLRVVERSFGFLRLAEQMIAICGFYRAFGRR